ncbi:MAG: alginate export family protein [Nitrospirota bacterium]|nr:alginate export family protein [Nitrospirota bacterium]MDH5773745.1 alginate export family protein [Nitrospirota bacterium]
MIDSSMCKDTFIAIIMSVTLLCVATASNSSAATNSTLPMVETDPGQELTEVVEETKAIALRGDDERLRPDSQMQTTIGNTLLTFTGALSMDFTGQNNFNLTKLREQDRFRWTPELNLNFILTFPKGFYLFTELGIQDELTFQEHVKPLNQLDVQIKEFFLQAPLPLSHPSAIRLGRQQFFEPRRWYLNDELDGFRFFYDPAPWHFSGSISTPILDQENRYRYFDNIFQHHQQLDLLFESTYGLGSVKQKTFLGSYVLLRRDSSPLDDNPIWFGLRSYGRPKLKFDVSGSELWKALFKPRLNYWIDFSLVRGTQRNQSIRGHAIDVGTTYIARKLLFEPYLTFGFAYGSGDTNPSNGSDTNFRQTGFQSNTGKFGGVVNFDYYGVLLDPELSNLHIYTAGFGFRPFPRTSVDFVYHYYRQNRHSEDLRDLDIRADPTGINKDLGKEFDVIVGFLAIQNMRFRLRTGYFIPGKAFDREENDPAFEGRLDLQFSF